MKYPFPQLQFPSTEALQDIERLRHSAQEIYHWIMTHVVGNDVIPRKCPAEIAELLNVIGKNLESLESKIRFLRSSETNVLTEIFRKAEEKESLSPTEYYYLRSLDLISGVSDDNSEYRKYRLAFESRKTDVTNVSDDCGKSNS